MPPVLDTDSQFRFLISCIRHSSAGKVDFEEVRKECDIISKGAAAKRYERLMKAHGIAPGGGAANGVKKEAKDAEAPKKPKGRANKKRKLQEVDDNETDCDEPIKEEGIKGEFKHEDAIVKPEYLNDYPPSATPFHHLPSQSESTSSSSNLQTDDNDDDEVLFVSATEKQLMPDLPTHLSDYRHHSYAHPSTSATPGVLPIEHAANMTFSQNPAALPSPPAEAMAMMRPSSSFAYGYTPANWVFPHESHGYL
ncbi:hypothetical protein F5Y08DRAFT_354649 [Xylaria arbuscula]|uniref:Myb-like DNA-binding domain-containing protein n=1 Tax=Xylaria arbuscula TaxID=114810 RepID=A0A9W8N7R6_9PEZI|nr:hypothetical protein F5Y08DRAFT_354649 [Xylaria arbuscula]KAJ3561380.1 hypothetical protein NPX13_g8971 [Xylaria arbuscula]